MSYRGYTINNSKLNSLWWISKGGFGIAWADSLEDAKAKIDQLLGE